VNFQPSFSPSYLAFIGSNSSAFTVWLRKKSIFCKNNGLKGVLLFVTLNPSFQYFFKIYYLVTIDSAMDLQYLNLWAQPKWVK
jgi:hypothetical protein